MLSNKYFQEQDFKCEIWRRIPGFLNYEVSNYARLRNVDTGNLIKPFISERKTIPDVYGFSLSKDNTVTRMRCSKIMNLVGFEPDTIPIQDEEFKLEYRRSDEFIYNCY